MKITFTAWAFNRSPAYWDGMSHSQRFLAAILSIVLSFSPAGLAEGGKQVNLSTSEHSTKAGLAPKAAGDQPQEFLLNDPRRPRSDFWAPLGSFFLPGLDQWIEGQSEQASLYSGGYLATVTLASHYAKTYTDETGFDPGQSPEPLDAFTKERTLRRMALASQTSMTFGALSAYQSFRGSAGTRKHIGQYQFLGRSESISEIASAPFNFSYLKRSSTYIPLGIAGVFAAANLSLSPKQLKKQELRRSFTAEDAGFALATSYNAGLWEEAVFRGWLLPFAYQQVGDRTIANLGVAGLFAIGHLSPTNMLPWPQLAIGYYLGTLTMDDQWNIGESIFIHTWWDVLILASQYSLERQKARSIQLYAYRLSIYSSKCHHFV